MSAPVDTPPFLGSLAHNQLCGVDQWGHGTYTAEGITKLCEALKGSAVTSLKCAATPKCLLSCQRPLTHTCPLTVPPPIPRSIGNNRIGAEGASALAAILKETMISDLECAAAQWCSLGGGVFAWRGVRLVFAWRGRPTPLTRLLAHHPHRTPRSQSRRQ